MALPLPRGLAFFKFSQMLEPFDDEALLVVFTVRDQWVKMQRQRCPRNLLLRPTMPIHQ
jgi:hypothetical protein